MDDKELDGSGLKLIGINGGIWLVPDVMEEPELTLRQWQVYEVEGGSRHLVGWREEWMEGRVSSKVVVFDASSRRARTDSGRTYELIGPPGRNGDADYVWNKWRRINKSAEIRQVCDFQSLKTSPGGHPQQPIEASHLGA